MADITKANEQILEIARVLMEKCDEELDCSKKADCDICRAERLCEKGYRKASDVAREIFEEIDAFFKRLDIEYGYFLRDVKRNIAELKKKYTEEP